MPPKTPKIQPKKKESQTSTKSRSGSSSGQKPADLLKTDNRERDATSGVNPSFVPGIKDSGGVDSLRPIGPGNPPRKHFFKPKNCANPKGYPKGRPNALTVIKHWLSAVENMENPLSGKWEKLTQLDIMILGAIAQARKGNVQALVALLDRTEGKPVQSTKLLNAKDKLIEIEIGFKAPTKKEENK